MQRRCHERALRAGASNRLEVFEVTYAARNIDGAWLGSFERGAEPVDVGLCLLILFFGTMRPPSTLGWIRIGATLTATAMLIAVMYQLKGNRLGEYLLVGVAFALLVLVIVS